MVIRLSPAAGAVDYQGPGITCFCVLSGEHRVVVHAPRAESSRSLATGIGDLQWNRSPDKTAPPGSLTRKHAESGPSLADAAHKLPPFRLAELTSSLHRNVVEAWGPPQPRCYNPRPGHVFVPKQAGQRPTTMAGQRSKRRKHSGPPEPRTRLSHSAGESLGLNDKAGRIGRGSLSRTTLLRNLGQRRICGQGPEVADPYDLELF
jgi:hypothetical protein